MKEVISGKVYDTDTAQRIATNEYWDGNNHDRNGRTQCLYKTAKGNYFAHHRTRWQGERDRIEPMDAAQALELWDMLPVKEVEFSEAFGYEPEEA